MPCPLLFPSTPLKVSQFSMASISDLPLELLLFIARISDYEYDLCALSQANRRLYFLLSPEVYRRLRETSNPALEWSAINGKKDCVRRLLEAGVPPDMNPTAPLKPIVLASYYGHTDVAKSFINTLGAACIKGHEQVVRLLMKHGLEAQPSSIHMSINHYVWQQKTAINPS
ncbi:ankyrin [Penicillium malachiteum]|nr:ankyrin [Penicillium malachiteum]